MRNRIFRSAWLSSFVDVWITPKTGRSGYFQKRSCRSKRQQGVSGSLDLQRAKGFDAQSPPATKGRGWCRLPRKYSVRASFGQNDFGSCTSGHSDRIEGVLEGTVKTVHCVSLVSGNASHLHPCVYSRSSYRFCMKSLSCYISLSPAQPNSNPMLSLHLLPHSPRNSTSYTTYAEVVVLSQQFRYRHRTQLSA